LLGKQGRRAELCTLQADSVWPDPTTLTVRLTYTPAEGSAWLQPQHEQAAENHGCPMAVISRRAGEP
jgi:hypothetical protein